MYWLASDWLVFSAWLTLSVPAIAPAICWATWTPRLSNCGMSTYWIPMYGAGCSVGCSGSVESIEASVIGANSLAAFR